MGGEESNGDDASLRVEVATVAAAEEGESDGEGVSPMLGTGVEEGVVSGGDRYLRKEGVVRRGRGIGCKRGRDMSKKSRRGQSVDSWQD